jgi:hypothetical protein
LVLCFERALIDDCHKFDGEEMREDDLISILEHDQIERKHVLFYLKQGIPTPMERGQST